MELSDFTDMVAVPSQTDVVYKARHDKPVVVRVPGRSIHRELEALQCLLTCPHAPSLLGHGRKWIACEWVKGPIGSSVTDHMFALHCVHQCLNGQTPKSFAGWAPNCKALLRIIRSSLPKQEKDQLRLAINTLHEHARKQGSQLGWGVCHGDAHFDNTVTTPQGAVLIDWGSACFAPREWDLAAVYNRRLTEPAGSSKHTDRKVDPGYPADPAGSSEHSIKGFDPGYPAEDNTDVWREILHHYPQAQKTTVKAWAELQRAMGITWTLEHNHMDDFHQQKEWLLTLAHRI